MSCFWAACWWLLMFAIGCCFCCWFWTGKRKKCPVGRKWIKGRSCRGKKWKRWNSKGSVASTVSNVITFWWTCPSVLHPPCSDRERKRNKTNAKQQAGEDWEWSWLNEKKFKSAKQRWVLKKSTKSKIIPSAEKQSCLTAAKQRV